MDIKWLNDKGVVLKLNEKEWNCIYLWLTAMWMGWSCNPSVLVIDGLIEFHSKVKRTDRIVAVYWKYTVQIGKVKSEWKICLAGYLTVNRVLSSHIGLCLYFDETTLFFPLDFVTSPCELHPWNTRMVALIRKCRPAPWWEEHFMFSANMFCRISFILMWMLVLHAEIKFFLVRRGTFCWSTLCLIKK